MLVNTCIEQPLLPHPHTLNHMTARPGKRESRIWASWAVQYLPLSRTLWCGSSSRSHSSKGPPPIFIPFLWLEERVCFHSFDLRHALATSLQTCSSSYRSCSQKRPFLPPQNPVFSTIPWHQTTRAAPCPPKRPEHTWIQRLMKWCPVVPPDHPLGLDLEYRLPAESLAQSYFWWGELLCPKLTLPEGTCV